MGCAPKESVFPKTVFTHRDFSILLHVVYPVDPDSFELNYQEKKVFYDVFSTSEDWLGTFGDLQQAIDYGKKWSSFTRISNRARKFERRNNK